MTKTIKNIAIFIDFKINVENGREYVDHASMQVRDENFDMIEHVSLHAVVKSEADLWEHVELTIQKIVKKGYKVKNPEVQVFRTHKSILEVDYFEAIGQHI